MTVPITQVDAFTDRPFSGNPAAVCRLEAPAPDPWMQAVAAEMNLSETAFLWPEEGVHRLRWFTPTREVDLCGHATLASAHVLWEEEDLALDQPARFETLSGPLAARREDGWIWLDFPDETAKPRSPPAGLAKALGAPPVAVAENRLDLLVELADEAAVRDLEPDLARIQALDEHRGVIVTAPGQADGVDYVCRYFAPAYGVDEDPVTGSIQCALGPWWAQALEKDELVGAQLSARGGRFQVVPEGERVAIGGQAVSVLTGTVTSHRHRSG